jgi:hypothetical protein
MRKPSPALVLASIALFVSLSGGAYAVGQALVTSNQIANGTVRLIDLHPSTKKALRGQRGPQGLRGEAGFNGAIGLQGPPGAPGAPGANGGFDPAKLSYIVGPMVSVAPEAIGTATADCPSGSVVIAGGSYWSIGRASASVFNNNTRTQWATIIYNDTSVVIEAQAVAICSRP